MRSKFGDELCYQVTGQVSFEACWPAAKLLWVKQHEPELFAKVRHILLLEDYVIYQLTGKFVAEGSLLTSTGILGYPHQEVSGPEMAGLSQH